MRGSSTFLYCYFYRKNEIFLKARGISGKSIQQSVEKNHSKNNKVNPWIWLSFFGWLPSSRTYTVFCSVCFESPSYLCNRFSVLVLASKLRCLCADRNRTLKETLLLDSCHRLFWGEKLLGEGKRGEKN